MGRGSLPAVIVVCAALLGAAAEAKPPRPLVPAGGMWQSIPYELGAQDRAEAPAAGSAKPRAARKPQAWAKPRIAEKAAKPAAKPRVVRHPVAAAAVAEEAPRTTAAARTKELERRIGILSPGAKLNEPIADPANPSWRRPRPGRPAADGQSLTLPFDEKGQAGFHARGYHAEPDVQNTKGNTGATFGVRTRF